MFDARRWRSCLALLVLVGCGDPAEEPAHAVDEVDELGPCEGLFGRPGPSTGLDASRCSPVCTCEGGSWQAPDYDEAAIAALESRVLLDPPAMLTADPYEQPHEPPDEAGVCAIVPDADEPLAYRLRTYPDLPSVTADGATVTHYGPCGLCSSLQDLAVYIRHDDLTTPVRTCGILGLSEGDDANLQCLLDLGFTPACAQIWFYNTAHTRSACFSLCIGALDDPFNREDGTLNPCLQCDEDVSGPIFKSIAGRTRRNSGLPSAICRPCDGVARVNHAYP